MIINLYEDNRAVIYQSSIEDYEKIKKIIKNLNYDFESREFHDYAEIIIRLTKDVSISKLRDIERRYKIQYLRLDYDFSEYERKFYKYQVFNLLRRINEDFHQSFKTIQSSIRFYVNKTLKEKGLEDVVNSDIYHSLMRIMMSEVKYVNRPKLIDEFLENNFLHRYIHFYQSLNDISKERYKSYSIESLETLGYII